MLVCLKTLWIMHKMIYNYFHNGLDWNSVWFDFCFIEILEEKVKLFFQSTFFSVLRMLFCIVTFVKWKKTLQFMCFRIYVTWNSLAD